jgi:hypothetical protein
MPVKERYVTIHLVPRRQQAFEGNRVIACSSFRRAAEGEAEVPAEQLTRRFCAQQDRSADRACTVEIHRKQLEPAPEEAEHPAPERIRVPVCQRN